MLNFKAVDQTTTVLHGLNIEQLDACIRPFFANLVTIITQTLWNADHEMYIQKPSQNNLEHSADD